MISKESQSKLFNSLSNDPCFDLNYIGMKTNEVNSIQKEVSLKYFLKIINLSHLELQIWVYYVKTQLSLLNKGTFLDNQIKNDRYLLNNYFIYTLFYFLKIFYIHFLFALLFIIILIKIENCRKKTIILD